MDHSPSTTRRRLLAAAGATTAGALGGCTDRLWGEADHARPDHVSLTVKTPPTDDDPFAIQIASHVTENLRAAGIDAVHEPVAETELYREVLMDRDFDVFVARHPGLEDVDELRSLLHSQFVNERGWQNPFSFSDGAVDDLLERQSRERGYERLATFSELFEHLLDAPPYTAVAYPEKLAGARRSLGLSRPPRRPLEYLSLLARREDDADEPLRVATFEQSIAERLNPLVVDVGDLSPVLGMVYDPLVRDADEGYVRWLAADVEWLDGDEGPTAATVSLREDLTWHDGTDLDAADVAFTFSFVDDTSLGEADSPVPAPRYRGRTSLVQDVTAVDGRRVQFSFGDRSREVAARAFTVPILPKHVWESRSDPVDGALLTEALVWDNGEPVGSGLLAVADADEDGLVALEPVEDHPLRAVDSGTVADLLGDASTLSPAEFHVSPNAGDAIDRLVDGDLDLLASTLTYEEAEPLADRDEIDLLAGSTRSFYLLGFNLRHPELGNPQFRRVVSRLVDREFLVEAVFGGRGVAASSHNGLAGVSPADWDFPQTTDVPSFPGADGEVDERTVRELFEDAGYRYDDGDLVA